MPFATWPFIICDVFTDRPLAGNQLAVFTDATPIPDALLQPLAREINFSETVFVFPPTEGGDARIRIFTPAAELPFAGHPVLGTAVALGLAGGLAAMRIETLAALVPVRLERRGPAAAFGRMEQPLPSVVLLSDPAPILAALGIERSGLPVERYDNGPTHVYVALPDEAAVAALQPDFSALGRSINPAEPVVSVSCFAGTGQHWTSRVFVPVEGLEDPATGSAAGPLAVHLARHGRIGWGQEIEISQGAEIGRPSTLLASTDGSAERIERVEVGGSAVIVGSGRFDAAVLSRA